MIKILKYEDLDENFYESGASDFDENVTTAVTEILRNVKTRGDKAVLEYTERFDGVKLSQLLVLEEEIDEAIKNTDAQLIEIMKESAANIENFHKLQLNEGFRTELKKGVVLGQRVLPIKRVGIYVPGGTAAYPSTVLMNAIPAKLAGVKRLSMVTPPNREGKISPAILAAAKIAGVDKIYKIGGAQAIAALAYGTETVERVYKITGPGNIYVAAAKRLVYGLVDIDMIAGPSDIFIIADENASPAAVAADMLAQAEHDTLARAILATCDKKFADTVSSEIERQLAALPRKDIAQKSIDGRSAIVLVSNLEESVELSNRVAPEHLEICTADSWALLNKITNAGSIFLGYNTPEVLGDYYAGTNHTLPTMGTAKFSSPLSVDDFVKKSQYSFYSKEAFAAASAKISLFANAEGLGAHAKSAEIRM